MSSDIGVIIPPWNTSYRKSVNVHGKWRTASIIKRYVGTTLEDLGASVQTPMQVQDSDMSEVLTWTLCIEQGMLRLSCDMYDDMCTVNVNIRDTDVKLCF